MNCNGIEFNVKNMPELDAKFVPMAAFNRAYKQNAAVPLTIAIERENGQRYVHDTFIYGDEEHLQADKLYVERLTKFLLWAVGGFRITICGNDAMAEYIRQTYCVGGKREFDAKFMTRVYEHNFEVISVPLTQKPESHEVIQSTKRSLKGCRIGFDAGGSDRKVSAVIDGEAVYSEEVVWHPKITEDPQYHYEQIVTAFKTAASKMPRVDAIGVSSAGIYVANRTMVASLFLRVPQDAFDKTVKDIYINAAREIGDVPLVVANDGDVTALAGAMELNSGKVIGIAMGTSLAAGYVDSAGNITGRLNELAFAPVDAQVDGAPDEWSGDLGCGVKYMSQDAVARLAPLVGISLPENSTPAEKLSAVQTLVNEGDDRAKRIFDTIGCYLGHSLAYYTEIYNIEHVLLLGRVMSGTGGNIIFKKAKATLAEDYPKISGLNLHLPDENSRRVGQSIAAASLPE